MSNHEDLKIPDIIKCLAEAVSLQTRIANRIWMALIFLAAYVLIPRVTDSEKIILPFGLGTVMDKHFYLISYTSLVVLYISFCVAYIQAMRSSILAQKAIAALTDKWQMQNIIHLRDIYDSIRLPSLFRVAPLAQMLLGENQFMASRKPISSIKMFCIQIIFIFLKIFAICVYLLLPTYSLYKCFWYIAFEIGNLHCIVVIFLTLTSILIVFIFSFMLFLELRSTIISSRSICEHHNHQV